MNTLTFVRRIGKPVVFLLCLLPALLVLGDAFEITGQLGANPVEEIQDRFGIWGLRFLMIVLAVTPLRQLLGRAWIGRFRRMLGLYGFFYVLLHFLVWLILDQGLFLSAILEDIIKRPFITIGMVALIVLLAMATTSTAGMRRRLGKRWQQIHYGGYAAALLGVWHYWWQVKKDISEPLVYAIILAALLGYRIIRQRLRNRATSRQPAAAMQP